MKKFFIILLLSIFFIEPYNDLFSMENQVEKENKSYSKKQIMLNIAGRTIQASIGFYMLYSIPKIWQASWIDFKQINQNFMKFPIILLYPVIPKPKLSDFLLPMIPLTIVLGIISLYNLCEGIGGFIKNVQSLTNKTK